VTDNPEVRAVGDAVVLVTGATSGLGRWLVERLGARGATVLVHGRDPARVEATVAALGEQGAAAFGYQADLASLDQVRRLAAEVAVRGDLTALINNAGVGFGPPGGGRELSADGYELRWAVDYLAPVALTTALLPTLRHNAQGQYARIVNIGSIGQYPIDFRDVNLDEGYSGVNAYRRAKLALAAWSFDLAERERAAGVLVNCIHPATFMDTAMVRESAATPLSTVEQGGQAVLRLLHEVDTSGDFYDGGRLAQAHPDAYDPLLRADLRALTTAQLANR
jgi:NAD(P)-dependent dehydrogenase (short-subunit alcohol dehydrogenase family)